MSFHTYVIMNARAHKVRSRRLVKGAVTPLFCLVDIHLLTKGVSFAETALKTLWRAAEANMNLQARASCFSPSPKQLVSQRISSCVCVRVCVFACFKGMKIFLLYPFQFASLWLQL